MQGVAHEKQFFKMDEKNYEKNFVYNERIIDLMEL